MSGCIHQAKTGLNKKIGLRRKEEEESMSRWRQGLRRWILSKWGRTMHHDLLEMKPRWSKVRKPKLRPAQHRAPVWPGLLVGLTDHPWPVRLHHRADLTEAIQELDHREGLGWLGHKVGLTDGFRPVLSGHSYKDRIGEWTGQALSSPV